MRAHLAERLLAAVMGWRAEDIGQERPFLQEMASFKYDNYQQYSPGMRFVESLALWLDQFRTREERAIAYEFFKRQLVYLSDREIVHFGATRFPISLGRSSSGRQRKYWAARILWWQE